MDPLLGSALIGAGASAFNIGSQSKMNRKQREFVGHMYNYQRGHALEDWNRQNAYNEQMWEKSKHYDEQLWNRQNAYNDMLWHRQNEYDSPAAQMARFKAAGINPHAMFGNLSGGPTMDAAAVARSSAPSAGPISQTSASSWNPRAPMLDASNFMAYADVRLRNAQVDNVRKDTELKDQEKLIKAIDITTKGIGAEKAGYERDLMRDGLRYSLEALEQSVKASKQQYDINSRQESRAQDLHQPTLFKLAAELKNARLQGDLIISQKQALELEKALKTYEVQLNQYGLQKNDNMILRGFGTLWNKPIFKDGTSLSDRAKYLFDQD